MALMPDGSYPIATFEDLERAIKAVYGDSDTIVSAKARAAVRDLLMKAMYYDNYANGGTPILTPAQLVQLQTQLADYNLQIGGQGGNVHVRMIRPRDPLVPFPQPPSPPAPPNVYGGTVATTFTRASGGAGGYSVTRHPTVQEIARTGGNVAQGGGNTVAKYSREEADIAHGGIIPSPVPEGVHLLARTRIGDAVRDRYLDHLRELFSTGHMTEDEFAARQDVMMKAETRDELEFLIRDLPALPAPPDLLKPASEKAVRYQVTAQQAMRGHTVMAVFWAIVVACTAVNVPLLAAIAGFLSVIYMIMAVSNFRMMKKVK